MEYRQKPVPKSHYHALLDEEQAGEFQENNGLNKPEAEHLAAETKIRYWSDFSRVIFHPRSIQRLPDLPEWEISEGNWLKGLEEFQKIEEVGSRNSSRPILTNATSMWT